MVLKGLQLSNDPQVKDALTTPRDRGESDNIMSQPKGLSAPKTANKSPNIPKKSPNIAKKIVNTPFAQAYDSPGNKKKNQQLTNSAVNTSVDEENEYEEVPDSPKKAQK